MYDGLAHKLKLRLLESGIDMKEGTFDTYGANAGKYKMAVCVFGQMRDYELSLPSIAEFASKFDAKVFISTWSKSGTKSEGVTNTSQLIRMFGEQTALMLPWRFQVDFAHIFPNFGYASNLDSIDVTTHGIHAIIPDAIIDIEDDGLLCLDFIAPRRDSNSKRMLYKIWRSNELRRNFEKQARARFEQILFIRPDIAPPTRVDTLAGDERVVYVPYGRQDSSALDDVMVYTSSLGADYYATLFGRVILEPWRAWSDIHQEMAHHFKSDSFLIKSVAPGSAIVENLPIRQQKNRHLILSTLKEKKHISDDIPLYFVDALSNHLEIFIQCHAAGVLAPIDKALSLWGESSTNPETCADVLETTTAALSIIANMHHLRELTTASALLNISIKIQRHGISVLDNIEFAPHTGILKKYSDYTEIFSASVRDLLSLLARRASVSEDAVSKTFSRIFSEETLKASLTTAIGFIKQSADALSSRAWSGLSENNLPAAERLCADLIEKYPDDWRGYDHLGHVKERQGLHAEALDLAKTALTLAPNHWGLHLRCASMSLSLGLLNEAAKLANMAASLSNDQRIYDLLKVINEKNQTH